MDDIQNKKDEQEMTNKLDALLEKAKQMKASIDDKKEHTEKVLNDIAHDVKESAQEIDEITGDLDNADKQASVDLDKLLIKQSEEIAKQENEGDE